MARPAKPLEQGEINKIMIPYRNLDNVMESETISKNEASPKSQTSRRNFLRIVLTITATLITFTSFAQAQHYFGEPKENERVIGGVTGLAHLPNSNKWDALCESAYFVLLEKAQKEYPKKVINLRVLRVASDPISSNSRDFFCSAKVVECISPETKMNETLVKAIDKALSKVSAGSRLAIDQISVSGDRLNRETVKDQLIDILLDEEYRVVAKEYLEKLKEEQEQQQSGGFNERTTAKTDNFSGVGYFLNIRVNEKSIRVQVINVSTGEYEGNATVDF